MTRLQPAIFIPLAALVACAGAWTAAPLRAQAPAAAAGNPTFEVASIRRNNSGPTMIAMSAPAGGRVTFTNLTVLQLITRAYQMQPYQVIGGPNWLNEHRFDIVAKAEGEPTPAQLNLMLRALLEERFKLAARNETRELPVYSLVIARADGRLGPALRQAEGDCAPLARGGGPGQAPAPAAPGAARGRFGADGAPVAATGGCRIMMGPGRLMASGQSMAQLATMLGNQVGRPVIDKTGLTGNFDFELSYLPDGRGGPIGPAGGGPSALPPVDLDAPSLFTALQEQLGLRLDAGRGPVEVLVIDRIETPTED